MSLLVSSGGGGDGIDQTARDAAAAAQATADSKQAALSNAGTLAKVTESAGLPLWDGAAWPGGGSDGTVAAAVTAHNTDPAAHLNIVRRTLAANLVLTAADSPHQRIIPDADRDVTLPAESTAQWRFLLCHAGASYNLTIKRAGGTTVGVLIPGSVAAVAWDGTGFGIC